MTRTSARDPLVGALLGGRYRLLDVIGHGGTGRVYRATQEPIGREVAVKVLHPDLDPEGQHDFQARFLREAAMAGRIQHPHVVTVHDYGRTEDGDCYIVMEHLRGRTLRSVLRDGRLPLARSLRIFAQLVRGLRATHRAGLVHRDVKPSNLILLDGDDGREFVKLFDFGLVKGDEESEITQTGTFMGTPQYVSPEQARGEPADARSDLYSAGVILYRMLTGVLPFEGDSPISIAVKHARDPYPPMKERAPTVDVPPEIERIVRRLMDKDPAARYRDADSLLEALRWAWDELRLDAGDDEQTMTVVRAPEDAPSIGSIDGVAAVDDALVALDEDGSILRGRRSVIPSAPPEADEPQPRKGRWALPVGMGAGLAVAAVLAVALPRRASEEAPSSVEAGEGTPAEVAAIEEAPVEPEPVASLDREVVLLVSSEPGGAEVWLDGILLGVTPLARRLVLDAEDDLAPVRSFRLHLDGYADGDLQVDISGSEAAGHLELQPLRRAQGASAAGAASASASAEAAPAPATAVVADGVRFSAEQAAAALAFVNDADGEALRAAGIAPRQANILLDQRPFPDLATVAATPFIGEKTLESILQAVGASTP